ncbi:MAG TPA: hypothetical protein VFY93_14450 [Planctomycetota bacterium]|nr:hypothetical protein [Planctomycetota bacterium]
MEYAIYKYCAIVGGVLVGLQLILQLFGMGGDHDVDAHADVDVDHGDLHGEAGTEGHGNVFAGILSFKALSAFAGVFGLVGLVTIEHKFGEIARMGIAASAGVASMFVVAWTMRGLARLSASGTVHVGNAVGATGTVYLRVPGHGSGRGKVTVEIQGRSMEFPAVTDGDTLETGMQVTVEAVEGDDLLKVVRS